MAINHRLQPSRSETFVNKYLNRNEFFMFRGNSFFSADRRSLEFQSGDRAIKNIMRTLIIFTARIVTTCAQFSRDACCQEARSSEQRYMLICCDRCTFWGKPESRRNFRVASLSMSFIKQPQALFTFHRASPQLVQDGHTQPAHSTPSHCCTERQPAI